jgi:hypothetical protein
VSQKRIRQIEQRIDRIKRALLEIGPMRPGSLTRQYKDPQHHAGDQLYPSDEESHGVRPPGMGASDSPPDRDPQAIQTPS